MKTILSVIFTFFMVTSLYSQKPSSDIITTTGSHFQADGFMMSWTIGDNILDFSDINEVANSIAEDYTLFELTDNLSVRVYPNKTSDYFYIHVITDAKIELYAELIDMRGSIVQFINVNETEKEVDISNFITGTYILRITDIDRINQKQIRIIKQ